MAARARRIVVGYDGTDAARRALDAAADLVGYGSLLAVVGFPRAAVAAASEDGAGAGVGVGSGVPGVLAEARERLLRRHVAARYVEPAGEAAEQLLGTADELGADLLVLGRTTRPALGRVLGSVLRDAGCDVLVVS